MITITFISTSITSLLFLVAGISVFLSWRRQKKNLLKIFTIFLICFGVQQFFFALGVGPFALNFLVSNWLWAIAHVFMFVAITYFIRFPISLRFSTATEKIIFRIAMAYSILGSLILFSQISKVKPLLLENGVYNWQVTPPAGAVIGIFTTACLLFSFGIFIAEGRKVEERVLKIRSFLLAAGILIFLTGGPLHNFIRTPLLTFLADASLILGSLLMMIGVYSRQIFGNKKHVRKYFAG